MRVGVGVGVGVDFSKPESESLKFGRLRSSAVEGSGCGLWRGPGCELWTLEGAAAV